MLGAGAFLLVAIPIALLVVLLLIRSWMKVARADEALVVSGRRQTDEAGTQSNITVIVNGRAVVNPLTQRADIVSLRSRQVTMAAEAQSEDNITLSVEAVALVKIGSTPDLVRRAAERFASQDTVIETFTTEQLEGALRGVVATLTVADLMRDRKKFSEQIAADVATDLAEQGLILDSFQIKGITDDVGYIASLGVPQIEDKRRAAEIAKTNSDRSILQRQTATSEENLIEQTALDRNRAQAQAEVGQARAEAEQAEALARARAEQGVLHQAASNRQAKLDADVRRVADAERYRREQVAEADAFERVKEAEAGREIAAREAEALSLRAEAQARAIQIEGEAKAAAIRAEAEALEVNREALLAQKALEILPLVMEQFAKGYGSVGEVTIIGGGADGGAGAHMASESASALAANFESIRAATGIDLAEIISASTTGRAIGRGLAESSESSQSFQSTQSSESTPSSGSSRSA